jgi:hypothetical protein
VEVAVKRRVFLHTVGFATAAGCVPMTFSRAPAVDFSLYRKVGVDVRLDALARFFGEARASSYLASELERDSGFAEVTVDLALEDIDLFLTVEVSLLEYLVEDEYGFLEFEYQALARFWAQDVAGNVVDAGRRAEVSGFPAPAIEFVLDEVALRYFKPYRL